MSDERLQTNLLGIAMQTPVLTASGTFGFGEEFADFVDLSRLGGVMAKGTTLLPRRGNDGVRITETPKGMLNCIGLENPGVEHFLKETLPRIARQGPFFQDFKRPRRAKRTIRKLTGKATRKTHSGA